MMCNIIYSRVNEILLKSANAKLIRIKTDGVKSGRLTLIEATENMDAYVRLNDGILNVIREQVDDEEVVNNLCMCVSLMCIF